MKIPAFFKRFTALLLIFCLLSIPLFAAAAAAGKKGEKEFDEGMKQEVAQQWDKAVEQFALAVAANPKNTEYRLHLARAVFNASQMFVQRGNSLAQNKDYVGAFNAFRTAYAYDPTNELAKAEMDRMVRLQKDENPGPKTDKSNDSINLVKTAYGRPDNVNPAFVSQRLEKVGNYKFAGVNLVDAIKQLAEELDLNVLFDRQSAPFTGSQERKLTINLKDVSAARALDYIFRQENLFFQKVGPKTILIATSDRRQFFTELVLRTFYLANANPDDVSKIVQQAIPVQPGRTQTFVQVDKSTNSLTLRDTEENIRIMEKLIKSLDKDRAEVVMDVNIYEVQRNDLLKLGNQIGTSATLGNIGGFTGGFSPLNGAGTNAAAAIIGAGGILNTAMGNFLNVPGSTFSALQTKTNTKLVASTQVHAFNNEESMARIGSRVPVKSAQYFTGNNNNSGGDGVVGDVFNYEQVGLTLKFTPIVFPNQDVQVKMSIESKDVLTGDPDHPTFSERSITGTARVQNNKTLMLASVAQGAQDRGKSGIPLLSFIPILGRLFATPTNSNRQTDIVIAVTPRVLRAPVVLPEDEEIRPTGSVVSPTSGSLEAMVFQEEQEEYLANARRMNNSASTHTSGSADGNAQVSSHPEIPGYVPSNGAKTAEAANTNGTDNGADIVAENKTDDSAAVSAVNAVSENIEKKTEAAPVRGPVINLRPIDTGVRTLNIGETADTSVKPAASNNSGSNSGDTSGILTLKKTSLIEPAVSTLSTSGGDDTQAELKFGADLPEMTKGQKMTVPVMIKSGSPFQQMILAFKYDDQKLAVRTISYGDIFGADQLRAAASPYLNKGGKTFVALNAISAINGSGILAYVEVEALADGKPQLSFDSQAMNMLAPGGAAFALNFK